MPPMMKGRLLTKKCDASMTICVRPAASFAAELGEHVLEGRDDEGHQTRSRREAMMTPMGYVSALAPGARA
jgi:hypothetical protein